MRVHSGQRQPISSVEFEGRVDTSKEGKELTGEEGREASREMGREGGSEASGEEGREKIDVGEAGPDLGEVGRETMGEFVGE